MDRIEKESLATTFGLLIMLLLVTLLVRMQISLGPSEASVSKSMAVLQGLGCHRPIQVVAEMDKRYVTVGQMKRVVCEVLIEILFTAIFCYSVGAGLTYLLSSKMTSKTSKEPKATEKSGG